MPQNHASRCARRFSASAPLASSVARCSSTIFQIVSIPRPSSALTVTTGGFQDGFAGRRQVEGRPILRRRLRSARDVLAVGLVDGERIGQLEDAFLDALELVAGARASMSTRKEVDHRGDGELGLPDTDRLDQDDVVAGRLTHEERLARPARHAAERAGRRARSDEGLGRRREARHARLVAEDAAAARGARRDRRRGRRRACRADQVEPEGLDEGALADPRDAADADARRTPGRGMDQLQEPLRRALIVGTRALDQRDRLGERPAVARPVRRRREPRG
jgi:hypothetical protein